MAKSIKSACATAQSVAIYLSVFGVRRLQP